MSIRNFDYLTLRVSRSRRLFFVFSAISLTFSTFNVVGFLFSITILPFIIAVSTSAAFAA